MKTRSLALMITVAASAAANLVLAPVVDGQRAKALGPRTEAGAPPEVAVPGILLGAFRGLAVDYCWLRALRLEDEGKFYEANDLARWISKLEPHLEQVWSHQAHNLAYNMSAAADGHEQRFRWISRAIELLRDEGIPLNPHAPELYFMLSRIYSDKIGGPFDDWQIFLKKDLALALSNAFGPLGEDPDLEGLVAAGDTLDPEAAALFAQLRATDLDLDPERIGAEGTLGWDEALHRAPRALELWRAAPPKVARRVKCFFRAAWARKVLRLDPKKCLEVEQRYGPLDWRGCDALSLYWAVEGERAAAGLGKLRQGKERRRLERLAINSVKHAARRGRLIFEPDGTVFFAPEPRLALRAVALYDEAIANAVEAERNGERTTADDWDDETGTWRPSTDYTIYNYIASMKDARREFLAEAINILARYGEKEKAQRLYERLASESPELKNESYDEFLNEMLNFEAVKEGATQITAYQIVSGNWVRAFMALALGDDSEALGRIALADQVYGRWQKQVAKARAEGDLLAEQRLGTVKIAEIKEEAFKEARARLSHRLQVRLDERRGVLGESKEPPR
jgi:hypothetical protein